MSELDWTFCPLCLQLLTNHYEQNWKYYCLPSGMGSFGTASDEELLLTKKLFWGIFDSLSHKVKVFFLLLTPTGSVERSWGGEKSMELPWAGLLGQNLTRWIIYQFVTGHLFATPPPLLSSSIILFLTVFDWLHPIPELPMKPFFDALSLLCVFAEVWCGTFQNG